MIKSIVFIINTYGDIGGHYYSLITTAEALRYNYNVHIVNIGKTMSPVIEQTDIPHTFLFSNAYNNVSLTIRMTRLLKSLNADVVHAFDRVSYLYSLFAARIRKIPIVVTKCGGAVNTHFPYVNNIVVFTKEDQSFFNSRCDVNETQIAFIPNRVIPFKQAVERIALLKKDLMLDSKRVVLRIGRIDGGYVKTAMQCIRLVKMLHETDPSFVLLLIGNVADPSVYKRIIDYGGECDFIHYITDRYYTLNAKELLDIAEVVVGTGRNFMEACSLGKTMMAPNKDRNFPVLVTSNNFEEVFYYNFSERYQSVKEEEVKDIMMGINGYCENTKHWFNQYFSYEMIEPLYSSFYGDLKPTKYFRIFKTSFYQLLSLCIRALKREA